LEGCAGSEFRNLLAGLGEEQVYFDPLGGNNGDMLIRKGAEHLLDALGCARAEEPHDAQCVFVNGGGYFNSYWGSGLTQMRRYCLDVAAATVLMGPQTYKLTPRMEKELLEICADSPSRICLYARDRISYKTVSSLELPPNVSTHLSQDLAFELFDSPFLDERKSRCTEEHVLLSLRIDRESYKPLLQRTDRFLAAAKNAPRIIRSLTHRAAYQAPRLAWGGLVRRILEERGLADAPTLWADASRFRSFEEFCRLIEQARFVLSDRLHVIIYAYLLGKPAVLVANPNYAKTRSVFEMCMDHPDSPVALYDPEAAV
jgi:exopolysaccharide biosynthesis predicted pyruvyltransferase EpsI